MECVHLVWSVHFVLSVFVLCGGCVCLECSMYVFCGVCAFGVVCGICVSVCILFRGVCFV